MSDKNSENSDKCVSADGGIPKLIHVLTRNLDDAEFVVKMSAEETEYLKTLINDNPALFGKIQKNMENILEDGKINLHDIPQIILLITNLYSSELSTSKIVKAVGFINIIEFTIETLLGIFPIPNGERILIDKIVHSSLELLKQSPIIVKTADNCFIGCLSFFCCRKI